jgi:hypothetical protein
MVNICVASRMSDTRRRGSIRGLTALQSRDYGNKGIAARVYSLIQEA